MFLTIFDPRTFSTSFDTTLEGSPHPCCEGYGRMILPNSAFSSEFQVTKVIYIFISQVSVLPSCLNVEGLELEK